MLVHSSNMLAMTAATQASSSSQSWLGLLRLRYSTIGLYGTKRLSLRGDYVLLRVPAPGVCQILAACWHAAHSMASSTGSSLL
jgi:hypothetical protein